LIEVKNIGGGIVNFCMVNAKIEDKLLPIIFVKDTTIYCSNAATAIG
jgi:hypothetical protein